MSFGKELKRIREKKGLTVNQLAIYSGVSSASISRYETGDRATPKAPTIEKLAKGLKMEYDDLMRVAGYMGDNKKESEYTLPEEVILRVIKEAEAEFKVSLRDDPLVESAVRDLVHNLAKMKKATQKNE